MRILKRVMATLLVACTVLSATMVDMTLVGRADVMSTQKIDAAIWNTTPDEYGRYLVYVTRDEVRESKIESEFNKRNDFTLAEYTDESLYRKTVAPSVAVSTARKYGLAESFSAELGRELFDDNIVPLQYELTENYNAFVLEKRKVITDLYNEYNNSFEDKYDIDKDSILYAGIFTGSYIMYVTREQIELIAEDRDVSSISVWENAELRSASNIAQEQIKTDSESGTKSSSYRYGSETGYKGTGIKIGVIEASGFKFNENAAMLQGANVTYVTTQTNVSVAVNSHATAIVSLLVGQSITVGQETYEGVVPNASVYQTAVTNIASVPAAISTLAYNYGVTVVSISAYANAGSGAYTAVDNEIDMISRSAGVTVVCAAGIADTGEYQDNRVATIGMGYNVITVGNYITLSASHTELQKPYSPHNASSYSEDSYLTNKPDIVAPGTNLRYADTLSSTKSVTGTSYATPLVAGVVAQLQQANSMLMESPTETKAILLAGADSSVISTNSNSLAFTGSTHIREKSGVGMVNAVKSMECLLAGNYNKQMLDLSSYSVGGYYAVRNQNASNNNVYLSAGKKIRIVLTHNKPINTILTSEYGNKAGISIYNGNTQCSYSLIQYSNVQIIEFTAQYSGNYTIKIHASSYNRTNEFIPWIIGVAWSIS